MQAKVWNQKMSFENSLEDLQLKMKQIAKKLKETKTKLKDCNMKMMEEIKLVQECRNYIDHHKQENYEIKSEQDEKAEKLAEKQMIL